MNMEDNVWLYSGEITIEDENATTRYATAEEAAKIAGFLGWTIAETIDAEYGCFLFDVKRNMASDSGFYFEYSGLVGDNGTFRLTIEMD